MVARTPSHQLSKAEVEAVMAETATSVSQKLHSDEVAAHLTALEGDAEGKQAMELVD